VRDVVIDAVVIIPGIMGSRLIDSQTRKPLWDVPSIAGLKTVGNLLEGWAAGRLAPLAVTEQERAGQTTRVRPAGLIKEPAWGPTFRLNFGYRRLTARLAEVVLHPDALLEFAYDWRLDIEHNGVLLARAIDRHLTNWRRHPKLTEWNTARRNTAEPSVVIVAHSMGGLVTRAMGLQKGALDQVKKVITIGTPFHGAVDAVTMLNSGRSKMGLPAGEAAALARTLPGLHDLLPMYRCLLTDGRTPDLTTLDAAAVEALGGDRELAQQSRERYERMQAVALPGLINLAGSHQPTDITFGLDAGVAETFRHSYERDEEQQLRRDCAGQLVPMPLHGDGTVQWQSARLGPATGYAQKHGALQSMKSVIENVQGQIEERPPGEGLAGRPEIGFDLPEYAPVGTVVGARVSGAQSAGDLSGIVHGLDGDVVCFPQIHRDGDDYLVEFPLRAPGVHILSVSSGVEPVRDAVLAHEPATSTR
jgi:pimeloyl-ACP methyl ester carboxylesterase